MFSGPELCKLDAHQVVNLLRRREVSPGELLAAALARIAQVEPHVNAMPTVCEERAHQSIRRLTRHWEHNRSEPGWLAGLPIGGAPGSGDEAVRGLAGEDAAGGSRLDSPVQRAVRDVLTASGVAIRAAR